MTLEQKIKERAKQLFSLPEDSHGLARMEADRDKTTWIKGAESMLPVMKDVAVEYRRWFKTEVTYHDLIGYYSHDFKDGFKTHSDELVYDYFLEHIFKPNLEK